jgi:hypothetical protein
MTLGRRRCVSHRGGAIWHGIVIQYRGQSMQEASGQLDQWLCCYDGSVYGEREAKKMAKREGRAYISTGSPGQPRHVKAPVHPLSVFSDEELGEAWKTAALSLLPPG